MINYIPFGLTLVQSHFIRCKIQISHLKLSLSNRPLFIHKAMLL